MADEAKTLVEEILGWTDHILANETLTEDVHGLLSDLEDRIANTLRRFVGKTGATADKVRAYMATANKLIGAAYDHIDATVEKGLTTVAKDAYAATTKGISKLFGVDFTGERTLSAPELKTIASDSLVLNNVTSEWWSGQAENLYQSFSQQMRLGLLNNENLDDLVKRVRGTAAANYTDGIIRLPEAQAEALIRTAMVNSANQARLDTYAKNNDLITAVRWITAHDQRVDDPCLVLADLTWTMPDDAEDYAAYKPIRHKHPFPGPIVHFNCRCVQAPVLRPLGKPKE